MPRYWHRTRRFVTRRLLHTDDTPHAVGLGAAVGMVMAWIPLIGMQTAAAVGLAALLRANKAICVPMVWISNPFTVGPFYYACYILGAWLLPARRAADTDAITGLMNLLATGRVFDRAFWSQLGQTLAGMGTEIWVGFAVLCTALSVVSYIVTRWLVVVYREHHRHRTHRRHLFRLRRRDTTEQPVFDAAAPTPRTAFTPE